MNSNESSQPLKDPRQITFVMLNRFWYLIKNPFTLPPPPSSPILPIFNGQYQAAWNANHKFWEGISVKSYKIQLPVISSFISVLISADIIFTSFQNFYNYLKKKFCPKFSFLNRFTLFPQPHPLNAQNLLNVRKDFCRFSLKCLLKYFFSKNLLTKSCKAFFKGFSYRFFGLLFKT